LAIVTFGRHPALLAGGLLGALFGKPRLLVITDQSVKLLKDTGKVKSNISEELASVPVDADLGELKGLNGKLTFPNGELAYVPARRAGWRPNVTIANRTSSESPIKS